MTPIQDIDFHTDGKIHFSSSIVVPHKNNIGAEVMVYDPRITEVYSSYHPIGQYQDVNSAYEAIVNFCKNYSSSAGVESKLPAEPVV